MKEPGLTYQGKPRTCGFRLSAVDVVVLVIATVVGAGGYAPMAGYSLFIPFVVYHFFLFCNVFRIRRKPELAWAGAFLAHLAAWVVVGGINIPMLFCLQLVVTVVVIAYEIRQPSYHGIFARRFNPRIDDYLSGNA